MSDVPADAPKLTRDQRQRLRWIVNAGGAQVQPVAIYWRYSVQALLALELATATRRGSRFIVLEITDLGRRALAVADAIARRSDVVAKPRAKGPWA